MSIIRTGFTTPAQALLRVPLSGADAPSVTQACFNGILKLRQPHSTSEIESIYNDLRLHLDTLTQTPEAYAIDAQSGQDIAYAVAAFADEVAAKGQDVLAAFWLPRSLQFQYFSDNTAGEGFYKRLEMVRQTPDRRAALQAFYVALALGFEGRYGLSGGAQAITTLMDSVRSALVATAHLQGSQLSAHGLPPETQAIESPRLRRLWIRPLAVVCAAVVVFGVMHIALQQATAAVVHASNTLFCQGLR